MRLALVGTGALQDLIGLPERYGQHIARIAGPALVWQSVTPFVPPRHIKAGGKNTLEGQIRAELRSRRFPEPATVRQLAPILRDRGEATPASTSACEIGEAPWSRFRHFKFARRRGPEPPIACGFAIRLEFEQPVSGPIAIGYGSHFGLGLCEQCA